jgi:hypothetical protein
VIQSLFHFGAGGWEEAVVDFQHKSPRRSHQLPP